MGYILISAATVGGEVLGAFLGPYVAKLGGKIMSMAKIAIQQGVKYKKFTENATKVHHFFEKPQHNLRGLLSKFGGNERKAYNATFNFIKNNGITGTFEEVIPVCGQNAIVRGEVIDGSVRLGTGVIK